ncbi:membrane-associated protein, putative, partial [Bodo saltans]
MTRMPCFYRSLNDSTVRLVPTSTFAVQTAYLYAGAILVALGFLPPTIALMICTIELVQWMRRRSRLRWYRRHVQTAPSSPNRLGADDHSPDIVMMAEVRAEPGTDWAGRLLCINDFAIAAAKRFENTLLVKAEECPLC